MEFTIFYDGACPLCSIEINHLKKRDHSEKLGFVDINHPSFSKQYPNLDWQAMNERIHGQLADGTWLIGLDVTHKAWSLVGKGWLYAPLRWPVIRWFADHFYVWFARHRHEIAYLLTRKKRCENTCESKLR
jgi:predicted DCC family thiol-disulfide oxidoreductase YuxK